MSSKVQVTVTAWNKDGYSRQIIDATERQVWSKDERVGTTALDGLAIDPSAFPEAVRFTILIRKLEDRS